MPLIQLPDGNSINFPDNPTEEDLQFLQEIDASFQTEVTVDEPEEVRITPESMTDAGFPMTIPPSTMEEVPRVYTASPQEAYPGFKEAVPQEALGAEPTYSEAEQMGRDLAIRTREIMSSPSGVQLDAGKAAEETKAIRKQVAEEQLGAPVDESEEVVSFWDRWSADRQDDPEGVLKSLEADYPGAEVKFVELRGDKFVPYIRLPESDKFSPVNTEGFTANDLAFLLQPEEVALTAAGLFLSPVGRGALQTGLRTLYPALGGAMGEFTRGQVERARLDRPQEVIEGLSKVPKNTAINMAIDAGFAGAVRGGSLLDRGARIRRKLGEQPKRGSEGVGGTISDERALGDVLDFQEEMGIEEPIPTGATSTAGISKQMRRSAQAFSPDLTIRERQRGLSFVDKIANMARAADEGLVDPDMLAKTFDNFDDELRNQYRKVTKDPAMVADKLLDTYKGWRKVNSGLFSDAFNNLYARAATPDAISISPSPIDRSLNRVYKTFAGETKPKEVTKTVKEDLGLPGFSREKEVTEMVTGRQWEKTKLPSEVTQSLQRLENLDYSKSIHEDISGRKVSLLELLHNERKIIGDAAFDSNLSPNAKRELRNMYSAITESITTADVEDDTIVPLFNSLMKDYRDKSALEKSVGGTFIDKAADMDDTDTVVEGIFGSLSGGKNTSRIRDIANILDDLESKGTNVADIRKDIQAATLRFVYKNKNPDDIRDYMGALGDVDDRALQKIFGESRQDIQDSLRTYANQLERYNNMLTKAKRSDQVDNAFLVGEIVSKETPENITKMIASNPALRPVFARGYIVDLLQKSTKASGQASAHKVFSPRQFEAIIKNDLDTGKLDAIMPRESAEMLRKAAQYSTTFMEGVDTGSNLEMAAVAAELLDMTNYITNVTTPIKAAGRAQSANISGKIFADNPIVKWAIHGNPIAEIDEIVYRSRMPSYIRKGLEAEGAVVGRDLYNAIKYGSEVIEDEMDYLELNEDLSGQMIPVVFSPEVWDSLDASTKNTIRYNYNYQIKDDTIQGGEDTTPEGGSGDDLIDMQEGKAKYDNFNALLDDIEGGDSQGGKVDAREPNSLSDIESSLSSEDPFTVPAEPEEDTSLSASPMEESLLEEEAMTVPDEEEVLLEEIKSDEGVRSKVYTDTVGKKTVGVGFNMEDPTSRSTWKEAGITEDFDAVFKGQLELSDESIDKLLIVSMNRAKEDASKVVNNFDELTAPQQRALTNMAFQLGLTKLMKFKNMRTALEEGDFERAKKEALNSKWAKQTPNRAERVADRLIG